jgi:PhoD-like phosphatase
LDPPTRWLAKSARLLTSIAGAAADKPRISAVHGIVIFVRHSVALENCGARRDVRLKLDFKNPSERTIATEFVTPAITSGGDDTPYGPYYGPMIPFNPHIPYYEGDRRGYFAATVTPRRMQLDLRFVTTVESPSGTGYTERSWVVEDGVPGAVPA